MRYSILFALLATVAFGETVKVPLKAGWKFVKADDPAAGTNLTMQAMSGILDRAQRGDLAGAPDFAWANPAFDDAAWRAVRVPHDWGVDSSFDSDRPYGDAFLDVTGVGWYRLRLKIEDCALKLGGRAVPIPEKGKVYFECDGAMSYAMLYLNGRFLGGWPYGYTRWRIDLTEHLNPNGENVFAIRCHNIPHSSRWYTGGGLFRDCRLLVCPEDHVLPGSVQITTPEVTAARAKVRVLGLRRRTRPSPLRSMVATRRSARRACPAALGWSLSASRARLPGKRPVPPRTTICE